MLGICLLYVGIVLINNGVCNLGKIDGKSAAVMNIFTGAVSLYLNGLSIIQGDYYSAGTGLLFGFTYLFVAINGIFDLDERPFAWFSGFVAVNAVVCAAIAFQDDYRMGIIWVLWAVLWATGFIETVLKKPLGKFVPYLQIFEGVVTAWVPGMMMLCNVW